MKITSEEHFGIARKIVSAMTSESWTDIPHACFTYEADVTGLLQEYKKINIGVTERDKRITINTILLKCICEGLKAAPKLNSHLEFNKKLVRGCLTCYENIDISMPTILPNGEMMTLNMKNVGEKSLTEITAQLHDAIRRSKQTDLAEVMYEVSVQNTYDRLKKGHILHAILKLIGSKTGKHKIKFMTGSEKKKYYAIPESDRLTRHDMEQGTTTVSNLGSIYREHQGVCTLLEIIPPQTTAFAIDAVRKTPVVVTDENGNDKIEIRSIVPITVAVDHRALDYMHAIPFMQKMDEIMANPAVIHSWK